ncbi:MAG: outer membrane protein assembly factor BamD [bacterium]
MKKLIAIIFAAVVLTGCSAKVDTTELTPEEHFNYALSLFNDEDYLECLNEFQALLLQYPGSAINDDSQYYYAMTYFMRDQYLLAAYEFSKLIKNIPASPFVADAQFMLAECYYELSPNYQLDQRYSKKAIEEFQAYIDFFPTSTKVEDAESKIKEMNDKLAEKDFNSAVIYEKMELYAASIQYYKMVKETYHDSKYAPMAIYNLIKLLLFKENTKEAMNEMLTFLDRFPNDSNAPEIRDLYNSLLDSKAEL